MKTLKATRINIMISQMDQSIQFYAEVLGLPLLNHWGDHYAEVQAANVILGLHPTKENTQIGDNLSIGLGVTNFDETVAELTAKGIIFNVEKDGYIRLAHFKDPDQNALYLAEVQE
ncbi:glyoxalase [Mangrovimonas sp. CR14]|uniref:VOC family protein n=1 Tax=Mangrovimonas sp. CR14 TaxID=2706120 RepID=UPI001421133A|nr:VOC family protein [Mangrovimonas sp. CR14]NIK93113.1 glyoxalase [Mangrovimonas sp. CR14]